MSDINLLQRKAGAFEQFSELERKLRVVSVWLLSGLFLGGLIIGVTFLVLSGRIRSLEMEKVTLARDINAQTTKEGLLLSLKDRVGVAAKALDAAKPWGKLFPILNEIAPNGGFLSLTIEESGRVSADMEAFSVDDAVLYVANLMLLFEDRKIRSPQLLSFALLETGRIHMSVSFYPTFAP